MVLKILLSLMTLGLAGCFTPSATVRLNTPTSVDLAFVTQFPDRREIKTAPESTLKRIDEELGRRNLSARIVPKQSFEKSFETRRSTAQRLEGLRVDGYLMLVEAEVRFYSYLNGKYRWNVRGQITMVSPDNESHSMPLELAAFLDFDHQSEDEAITYVEVAIAERAGQLADRVLAGLQDGSVTLPER